ncbi:unnamed protein product [Acanthocheilonema viteae]|uniref:Uncharacterized protein n=1 Tax=Acanthocheilonema viteae TaxID=6277 RepID=A0A498SVL0_ACAVI|nr:unnamed protein product [Acanthocheilonema viteae]
MDSTKRDISSAMAPTGAMDVQFIENSSSQTDGSVDRTNKYQETTDVKMCKLSDQFMDQRNGSNISNLNDVLILNAAVNSFLWANAAAGTDGANAFVTPEMLASLSAAGLSPSLGVPCSSTLTDNSLHLKTSFDLAKPVAPEVISEPAEFVVIGKTLSSPRETLKPLVPLSPTSASESMLPACGTLLLNHSTESVTKTSPSCTNDGM